MNELKCPINMEQSGWRSTWEEIKWVAWVVSYSALSSQVFTKFLVWWSKPLVVCVSVHVLKLRIGILGSDFKHKRKINHLSLYLFSKRCNGGCAEKKKTSVCSLVDYISLKRKLRNDMGVKTGWKLEGKDEGMPDRMHIFSVVSTNVVFYFP